MENVKEELKSLAETFSLKFKRMWLSYTMLPPRKLVICIFLLGCPLPEYQKFGSDRSIEQRFENLQMFVESEFFKERALQYKSHERSGGTIVHKPFLAQQTHISNIKETGLREEVEAIFEELDQHIKGKAMAVVSETVRDDKRELVLKHEWIHLLLEENGISFQKSGKGWEWDEGLVTYLTEREKIHTVKEREKKAENIHSQYALKWERILGDCETPDERLAKIKEKLGR